MDKKWNILISGAHRIEIPSAWDQIKPEFSSLRASLEINDTVQSRVWILNSGVEMIYWAMRDTEEVLRHG